MYITFSKFKKIFFVFHETTHYTEKSAVESVVVFNPEQHGSSLRASRCGKDANCMRPEMFRTPSPLLLRCMFWMLAREVVRFRPAPASTQPQRHATVSPVKPFSRHRCFTCCRCFCVKMFPGNLFVVVVYLWVWTNWKRPLCVILKKKTKKHKRENPE